MGQTRTERLVDWHPVVFVAGCCSCAILLTSWFFEPTRSLWLALDDRFFLAVNGSLAGGRGRQVFWAVANNRIMDLVSAMTLIGLYAHYVFTRRRHHLDFFIAVGLMLTGMLVFAKRFADAIASLVRRGSPTLVHEGALRLSELVPGIPTKDAAYSVFPGDHTAVLILCAGVITFYLPRAYAVAAWAATIVFSLPRLVGGGHWLSDDLVGAVSVAGLTLTYVLATPLHRFFTGHLEKLVTRIRGRLSTSGS